MKYIRTKDGIYEIMPEYSNKTRVAFFYKNWKERGDYVRGEMFDLPNDEIKLGDTIEELCDIYVVENINTDYFVVYYAEDFEVLLKNDRFEGANVIIYGAIWIKGEYDEPIFKSVAKMNEKGELELL